MDKLIAKFCYKITLRAESPISVGSGLNVLTDHDIIQYSDTYDPFIPGSTIAGCFFGRIENKEFFGIYDDVQKVKESPLFVSDGLFDNNYQVKVRDGIKLKDDSKISEDGAKFNTEIIDAGATFSFRLEYTVRGYQETKKYNVTNLCDVHNNILNVLNNINSGNYRIGYKQTRGFGKVSVLAEESKYFIFSNEKELNEYKSNSLEDYLKFNHAEFSCNGSNGINISNLNKSDHSKLVLEAKCSIDSGIIIREYVKEAFDHLDYKMIKSNEKPVIPASTINGVLRSNIRRILKELGKELLGEFINPVKQKSVYTVEESIINDGTIIRQTRNAIDRFSGGAKEGALMTEEVCFGGTTSIRILFDKNVDKYKVGLMILALRDIIEGYTPIGGQTAIGRGILKGSYKQFKLNGEQLMKNNGEFSQIAKDYVNDIIFYKKESK